MQTNHQSSAAAANNCSSRTPANVAPPCWSNQQRAWILTRYSDVAAMLRHPDALAIQFAPFIQAVSRRGPVDLSRLTTFVASISLMTRPPEHDRIRRLLANTLGGFRRTSLPAALSVRAEELLCAGSRQGTIDLAEGYGRALALFTIAQLLGVPESDLPLLSSAAEILMGVFDRMLPSISRMMQLNVTAATMLNYFTDLISERRTRLGEDGLSTMIRLASGEDGFSDDQLAGFCTFFFIAGEETTAAGISSGMMMLLSDHDLRSRLRAAPENIPNFAREVLRLASPVQYVAREAGTDFELDGQVIRAGQAMFLMLGAANRDPIAFPQPDRLDLDRTGPEPLAFAAGAYRCIGAQLATFEIELATTKLLDWPSMRLSTEPPVWQERLNIAGPRRLLAEFHEEGRSE